ncbi:MAG: hypothetical protein HC917_01605 [Richelia sp. SM2_1_7]|nr:hypothetical protein [Richelia sp. SM2_1_7]
MSFIILTFNQKFESIESILPEIGYLNNQIGAIAVGFVRCAICPWH